MYPAWVPEGGDRQAKKKEIYQILVLALPFRYPYFDIVVRLAWSCYPESYAGGGIATGRISHVGQVKGDDPDKKGYPGPLGWGLSLGLTTPPHKKPNC
jgi:hypothetical protein